MSPSYRTWVEISGVALRHNLRSVRRRTGNPIMPVVKANAYGHGTRAVIESLRGEPIWGYGVAYGSEALELRQLGWRGPLLVLSYWQAKELPELVRRKVTVVVWDMPSLGTVAALPAVLRRQARIHIKLDTGTTRIGFLPQEFPRLKEVLATSGLRVTGVFSHFANAESRDANPTLQQISRFTTLRDTLALPQGITSHIACTAAAIRFPEAKFGLLRLGIGLYGLWPSTETRTILQRKTTADFFRPAMVWKSRLSQVKRVPSGTSIGYGASLVTRRPSVVGVVPVGYSDGLDRKLSNRGWVMVNGRRAPILGRVCMNLTMVDLTDIPRARVGTTVTLLGPGVTAEVMAGTIGTIHYEVTTRINPEIPRLVI